MSVKPLDITGRKFGRLVAIRYVDHTPGGNARWLCVCDCGKTRVVCKIALISGTTKSCRCLAIEKTIERSTTHGKTNTPEFRAWSGMKDRCLRKGNKKYKHYGGRGITICKEWIESFDAFLRDVGPRPGPELSIDRIDNNDGYHPGNVRWATHKEQCLNRRPREQWTRGRDGRFA